MNFLAIDTSTEILSLLGSREGKTFEVVRDIDLHHSEQLIPLVDWVFSQLGIKPADLDLLVAAGGPGSFTGLRIGLATVKGISAGVGCPYVIVSSLDAFAARLSALSEKIIAPVVDAKKQRFYTALWKGTERITDYLDISPEEFKGLLAGKKPCILTGPHAHQLKAAIDADPGVFLDPYSRMGSARMLAQLGLQKYKNEGPAEAAAGPEYIRKSDAELSVKSREQDSLRF
jgi:tRNA threonylcarbamoyladenosine biosynthesis protein TsaB